jgi:hypothetical protein
VGIRACWNNVVKHVSLAPWPSSSLQIGHFPLHRSKSFICSLFKDAVRDSVIASNVRMTVKNGLERRVAIVVSFRVLIRHSSTRTAEHGTKPDVRECTTRYSKCGRP